MKQTGITILFIAGLYPGIERTDSEGWLTLWFLPLCNGLPASELKYFYAGRRNDNDA